MQGAVSPAACCGVKTLFMLAIVRAHTQFLSSSTTCTAIRHLLCKVLVASKWGRYDIYGCRWWKHELTCMQGAVFLSQISVGAYRDSCLSYTTNVVVYEYLESQVMQRDHHQWMWSPSRDVSARANTCTWQWEVLCPILLLLQSKNGRSMIGFTSPTNQAQSSKFFMSLYTQAVRETFYIWKVLSRHHLSAGECGQACFISGHWGQQPSSTICV